MLKNNNIKKHLINIPGWHTRRKIVVFESDDWGTIRMASKAAYNRLLNKGYPVDKCPYNSNDTIERNEDVEKLIEVLLSVNDKNQNPAKFTIDNIVANPNFDKIKESQFKEYYFEPFTETLKKYRNTDKVLELYKKGINENVFQPQFHGREHVNVNRWLEALQNNDKRFIDAFEQNMFSIAVSKAPKGRRGCMDSFGENFINDTEPYKKIIQEGTRLFEKIWSFKSKTFIAPCYVWPSYLEKELYNSGILALQGTHIQREPIKNDGYKINKKFKYTGKKNKLGQFYLVRNVFFEPTEQGSNNAVENTLKGINLSFKYYKPAIISSHRVNYIGSINPENRDRNLRLLSKLLYEILKQYPTVEFMSSDELLDIIKN